MPPTPLAWVAGFVVLALSLGPLARRTRLAVLGAGWLLLGLARGGREEPVPPAHDGPLLFQIELADDALDGRVDRRSAVVLAAWPAQLRVDDDPTWRGRLPIELRAPGGSLPEGGPGSVLLTVGRLAEDRRGLNVRPRGPVVVVREAAAARRFPALRRWLRERMRAGLGRIAPTGLRGLFVALVLGERSGLTQELQQAFTRTGTVHLLSISGLHIGSCWVGAAAVARRLLVYMPLRFVAAGWPGRIAPLLACSVASMYVLVAGAPEAGQRSLGMTVFLALSVAAARRPSPFNTLCGAVCAVVWYEPQAAASLGFQLSVASVAGLIAWTPVSGPGWWGGLRTVVATGVIGTLASAPLVALFWGQVPLAGVWVNAVAVPLLGPATIPPLLIGSALALVNPLLGAPFVWLASLPAWIGVWVIAALGVPSRAPNLSWQPDGATVVFLYAAAYGALVAWRNR